MRIECPNIDLRAEHRKFIDYWISEPGQRGTKLDWNATWRNWIRRSRPSHSNGKPSGVDKARAILATLNTSQGELT